MRSRDEEDEYLDSLEKQIIEEGFRKLEKVLKECDEFEAFLNLWVNEVEKYFGKCKVKYKLKGTEEWEFWEMSQRQ